MGDCEKEVNNSNATAEDITVEDMVAKTATAKSAKEKKKAQKKKGFFSGVVAEFKKIIWPNRNSLFKQTLAVVVSSVILGAIIVLVDLVIRLGIEKFLIK